MNPLKKMAEQLNAMSRAAYFILKVCLIISILYLVGGLLVLVYAGNYSEHTYNLYNLARDLYTMPQAILIIAAVGCSFLERAFKKSSE